VSSDGTNDSEFLSGSLSFLHLQEFGGLYSFTLVASDSDVASLGVNPSTGDLTGFADTTTAESADFHFEMPLLRGCGTEVNTVDILLSRSGFEGSRDDLQFEAIRAMKLVEDAYWDLLATQAALGVARESLELAEDLYELNKKKVEVGTLAPIDVTQAEAGVADREEDVIVAETAAANAEDELRRLLGIPHGDPMWSQRIVLTDRPQFKEQTVDLEAALATALDRRTEIRQARRALEDSELSERVARNGVRHDLSLSADVTFSQDDGDQTITRPISALNALSVTNEISDGDGTDWSVGVTYRYPLHNRQAKANYAIAKLNRRTSDVALAKAEQEIRVDVRVAARNVESGIKRVEAARANTSLQRKTLEAEQKKYENGMSTSFEVLRIQTDLSDAQFSEIQAVLAYTKSLADLERAKGTLLEARGLALD
jgi:outer membrane protein TolC